MKNFNVDLKELNANELVLTQGGVTGPGGCLPPNPFPKGTILNPEPEEPVIVS